MHDSPQTWFRRGAEPLPADLDDDGLLTAARARLEELAARSPDHGRHACRAGCTACCHYRVGVTASEARALARAVRDHPRAVELTGKIRERAVSPPSPVDAPRPCALLDEQGSCSVYAERPLPCRGWTALDRQACDDELAGRGSVPRPDAARFHAGRGVGAAVQAARPDDPLDPQELHQALARLLGASATG